MLPIQKKLRLVLVALAISLISGIALTILYYWLPNEWNLFRKLDTYFYYLCYTSDQDPAKDLIIVDLDDPAESRNRAEIAALLDRLKGAEIACVAFDISYIGNKTKAGDQRLVNSIKALSQKVILPIVFLSEKSETPQSSRLEALALPESICQRFVRRYSLGGVELPFDSLFAIVEHVGTIQTINNEHHHVPMVIRFGSYCYGSLAMEAVRLYHITRNQQNKDTQLSGSDSLEQPFDKNFQLYLQDIPLDGQEQLLVNFIARDKLNAHLRTMNWEVARQRLQQNPEEFKGKIILVVNAHPSAEDEILTPVGPYPPWAVHASMISQLISENYIEASILFYPLMFSAILISTGLFWFLFVTPRLHKKWRRTRTLFLSGNAMFLLIIYLLFTFARQWIGVAIPLIMFNLSLTIVRKKYYQYLKAIVYVDFNLAILERQGQRYPIQLTKSPAGEEEGDFFFESFLEEEEVQDRSQKFAELTVNRHEMIWLGDKLFNAVFPSDIAGALTRSLDMISREDKHLRINLRLDASELITLPWELLHSVRFPPGFLVLHKKLSLTRYLPLAQPIRKSKFRIPLRVLVVISSPTDLPTLDVKSEKKLIKKALLPLSLGGDVRLRFCEHATLEKFSRALESQPDIVHYIGHGHFDPLEEEAFLALESEQGNSDPVSSEMLGNLLHESSVKVVILNSCESATASLSDSFSGIAQNLIRVGIPAVVAMQCIIPDETAILFSKAFYSTFITNYSIDTAVAEARQKIVAKTSLKQEDWAIPVLFLRANNGNIFEFEASQ